MKKILGLIIYLILPLPAILLYVFTGAIVWSGWDEYSLATILGITAFTWFSAQMILAAKPWGLGKILGTPTLMRLHGVGALLSLGSALGHFYIKKFLQGQDVNAHTLLGFTALILFIISALAAVLFLGNHFPSPAKKLKTLREWFKVHGNWTYKGLRSFHNLGVVGVALAGTHVLLASTTQYSWATLGYLALFWLFSLGIYLRYRIKGRS